LVSADIIPCRENLTNTYLVTKLHKSTMLYIHINANIGPYNIIIMYIQLCIVIGLALTLNVVNKHIYVCKLCSAVALSVGLP